MRVCIDKKALGTPQSLIVDSDGTFEWNTGKDCDVCLFDRDSCNTPLEDLARMQGITLEGLSVASRAQAQAFEMLGVNQTSVPWLMALGKDQFTDRIGKIAQTAQNVVRDHRVEKYVKTYGACRKFLKSLSRPSIDAPLLRQYVAECESGLSVIKTLKSFTPDANGHACEIKYDQAGTSTGRLTVESGPSILTLPKQYRNIIRSTCGGSVYEVDFVSLEPRFVLHVMGIEPPEDIYEHIRQSLFKGELTRKIVKLATLSALYGSSSQLLSELTGITTSSRPIIRRVKEYFKSENLADRLTAEIRDGGLYNYYGRPLFDLRVGEKDTKLLSHYVQSSSVDTALLGFSKLAEVLKSLSARPIYVIHDAVMFDVPMGHEDEFKKICDLGINLDIGHFKFGVNKIS